MFIEQHTDGWPRRPGRCNDESQVASGVMTPFVCQSWKLSLGVELADGGDVEMECLGEVQSCGVKRQVLHGCPEVERVAVRLALGIQAAKHLFDEIDGEGPSRIGWLLVDRTGAAALGPVAAQTREHVEPAQDVGHADLSAQVGKVDSLMMTGARFPLAGVWGRRLLAGRRRARYFTG